MCDSALSNTGYNADIFSTCSDRLPRVQHAGTPVAVESMVQAADECGIVTELSRSTVTSSSRAHARCRTQHSAVCTHLRLSLTVCSAHSRASMVLPWPTSAAEIFCPAAQLPVILPPRNSQLSGRPESCADQSCPTTAIPYHPTTPPPNSPHRHASSIIFISS